MEGKEQRSFKAAELRVEGEQSPVIRGYAAVFNSTSEDLGYFREIIRPGAFKKTINDGADVRALFNHNPNYIIARTKSNTLKLSEDGKGLFIEATPPDTTWARDLVTSIKRGDIDQMSFGFETVKDRWGTENGDRMRELLEVRLFDVSPVTYPAYPQTSVSARSFMQAQGINFEALSNIIMRSKSGDRTTKADTEIIIRSIEILQQFIPKPEPGNHSGAEKSEETQARNLAAFRRRIELAERSLKHKTIYGGI